MSIFFGDVKQAMRQLWRRPAYAAIAVLTLAIGIGVNTVAFTVVNGVLFKGSARSVEDDVGRVETTPGGDESAYASLIEYARFADATKGAVDLAAEGRLTVSWQHDGVTETAWVLFVSRNYFAQVTARPLAGRLEVFRGSGGVPAVVIGERFWRRKLDAAPLAGLQLRLNGVTVAVAGVVPDTFTGPAGLYSPDAWLPLDDLSLFRTSPALRNRDTRWLYVFGRVRPGIPTADVQGRVDAAAAAMARDWPDTHTDRGARFRLRNEINSEVRGVRQAAAIAMGVIGLVLLLACFNVANLLLARAIERQRDIAIRAAIGAGPLRLIRLVIVEGLVIAALAGAAALLVARWTQVLVGSFAIPIEQPQHIDLTPDGRVVLFVLLLVAVAGVLPGLWPALAASRVDVSSVLVSQGGMSAGGRPSRMRRWLVAAQIAGSTAFLAIAALFVQAYGKAVNVDVGFDDDRLVLAEAAPASHGYDSDRAQRYFDALAVRARALPGVADVALAHRAPFFIGYERMTTVSARGACEPDACPKYATMSIGPGYFRTLGITLDTGREFGDRPGAEVILNQMLASELWPDGGGLGETVRLGERREPATVVGIVAKARTRGPDRDRPTLYVPLARADYEGGLTLIARTSVAPHTLIRPLTEAAHAVDRDVALLSVKTMRDRMAVQMWPFRTASWLFSICGALALVLGTVGLAAVVIHAVNRRLREFGVRLAIGATSRHLVTDVLGSSVKLLIPGVVLGIVLAAVIARLIQFMFLGVSVLNPATYLAVALLQTLIVILACVGPALRAARVDPLVALRSE